MKSGIYIQLFKLLILSKSIIFIPAGKSHSDDLFVLFDPVTVKQNMSRDDLAVQNLLLTMFQSFWKTGCATIFHS
jgi:hypothetical protein